ncbi:hypothetical protein EVAR_15135_1 [Eumeta japonica]|uniref:Uncharacterized protein n=1 Tax=Eumeta variegata TaxID=151549 RepID=A0A4C1UI28_EUMVA|nr:hypothetical protein EVAR_15135_1 [Eumeta japonica]
MDTSDLGVASALPADYERIEYPMEDEWTTETPTHWTRHLYINDFSKIMTLQTIKRRYVPLELFDQNRDLDRDRIETGGGSGAVSRVKTGVESQLMARLVDITDIGINSPMRAEPPDLRRGAHCPARPVGHNARGSQRPGVTHGLRLAIYHF